MPIDRKDLEARIAAATPQDTTRGLAFNALFDSIEEHLGKEQRTALDHERKGHRVEFFSYPVADYLRISFAAAERMGAKLGSTDAAFRAFGYRTLANVLGSKMGATILALAGRKGPRGILGQTASGYRAMVSYGTRTVEWVADRHARITFSGDFMVPPYHCGIFDAVIEATDARVARVEARRTGLLDSVYDVVWTEAK
jgi:uncharacterized protein (TIGR02265 family)